MRRCFTLIAILVCFQAVCLSADVQKPLRRKLNVALYQYISEKAELYWKLEQAFEDKYEEIDLRYVETGASYYKKEPAASLRSKKVDVAEIDTVLLADLVAEGLIGELPDSMVPKNIYLPVA